MSKKWYQNSKPSKSGRAGRVKNGIKIWLCKQPYFENLVSLFDFL